MSFNEVGLVLVLAWINFSSKYVEICWHKADTSYIFIGENSTVLRGRINTMYSVTGKQCPQTIIKKSLVFLTVNLHEILHASTYSI